MHVFVLGTKGEAEAGRWTDEQTDGHVVALLNAPPTSGRGIKTVSVSSVCF